ncbi:tyrosine-type recombinase/integrase [Sulfitobacter sp. PM12]|uniref:tyrosine-type recombinase/integrase n=1 Tax=Sulfitobacter sp. PM12 TaxID=3138497 RepID=UPI00388EBD80
MIRLRSNKYQLYKRVPSRFSSIESRTFVTLSLHTDSASVARSKADRAWAQMVEAWEARLAGDTAAADQRLAAARDLAAARGYRYLDAGAVAKLPVNDVLSRIEAVPLLNGAPDKLEASAILGGAPESLITVSKALDQYWSLAADKVIGKSPDQLRRWRNPRIKAVKNFVAVVGDKQIGDITGDDMLDFRGWWMERIEAGEVTPNAGNKDLIHLGDILKTINKMKRLGLRLPLSDLAFKNSEAGKRPPFSDTWIKDRLLMPGALDRLNDQARAILLVMINTGLRPSEIAGLTRDCIKLDTNVPHVSIEPIGRHLKSKNARRVMPLLGVSLEALRAFPDGFNRYRLAPAGLSAVVNKYLRAHGLLETPEHSMYGLRHSFEDRLLAAGVDERIRRDLFGHSLNRERYGAGASLAQMSAVIQPMAF